MAARVTTPTSTFCTARILGSMLFFKPEFMEINSSILRISLSLEAVLTIEDLLWRMVSGNRPILCKTRWSGIIEKSSQIFVRIDNDDCLPIYL
jgi:hypothetical protein